MQMPATSTCKLLQASESQLCCRHRDCELPLSSSLDLVCTLTKASRVPVHQAYKKLATQQHRRGGSRAVTEEEEDNNDGEQESSIRREDASASDCVQTLEHSGGDGGPSPHLGALAQLIHQNQRVLRHVVHHIPASQAGYGWGGTIGRYTGSRRGQGRRGRGRNWKSNR